MTDLFSADTIANLISTLGASGDKANYTRFIAPHLTQQELDDAYRGSWMVRKVIDIPPQDMTREWREWQADDKDIELLEEEERRLDVIGVVFNAMRWARLRGGAGIVIGLDDRNPEKEINVDKIKQGSLKYLHALTAQQLRPGDLDPDPASGNFMKPMWFDLIVPGQVASNIVRLHYSRVVPFMGITMPPDCIAQSMNSWWGDPLVLAIYDTLINSATASQVMASLLHELKIDVITIPNLGMHLSTEDSTRRLSDRFARATMLKSLHNMLLISDTETFTQKQISLAGLPDMHVRFLQEAAGTDDIPITRFLGQSPAGLTSTGEHDLRNYYDGIAGRQNRTLRPTISILDEILIRSALGKRPDDIWYDFRSLWQLTPEQKADVALKKAQAYAVDVQTGLIDPEALRIGRENQLIEDGTYPGFEVALEEAAAMAKELAEVAPLESDDDGEESQEGEEGEEEGGEGDKKGEKTVKLKLKAVA